MLTGILDSSGGDALIFGHSINTDMSEIRKVLVLEFTKSTI